jgi:hypothetical protein
MKKFSTEIGTKVGTEPKIKYDKNLGKELDIKNAIFAMLNEFVHIRLDGACDPVFLQNVHISGKEMFTEALYKFFENRMIKENKDLMGECRNRVYEQDIAWIDSKLDFLNEQLDQYNSDDLSLKNQLIKENLEINIKKIDESTDSQ